MLQGVRTQAFNGECLVKDVNKYWRKRERIYDFLYASIKHDMCFPCTKRVTFYKILNKIIARKTLSYFDLFPHLPLLQELVLLHQSNQCNQPKLDLFAGLVVTIKRLVYFPLVLFPFQIPLK